MSRRLIIVLERPLAAWEADENLGAALARVAEVHPALEPLLDFAPPSPQEIAQQVGMTYAYDPEDLEDLAEIDFGPQEWFEPTVGLAAVQRGLEALRGQPESVAAVLYDPHLRTGDVIADLEQMERCLQMARQEETRFRFAWCMISRE